MSLQVTRQVGFYACSCAAAIRRVQPKVLCFAQVSLLPDPCELIFKPLDLRSHNRRLSVIPPYQISSSNITDIVSAIKTSTMMLSAAIDNCETLSDVSRGST